MCSTPAAVRAFSKLFGVVGGERSVVLGTAYIDHRLDLVGPQMRAVAAIGDQPAAME